MGRAAEVYAKVSPKVAGRPGASLVTKAHAWALRHSDLKLLRTFFGAPVLVLRTTGRKSGVPRDVPLCFVRDGQAFAVVASNAAAAAVPAWWLNLQAQPECTVRVGREEHALRGRRATEDEAARLWPALQAVYPGFDHYKAVATRELPVVLLEPR